MKKAFSIFLVFATFFIVSCGGLLEEEPRNTVRITMGNARSVSASGASDVNYYNIVIQNQTFSNVAPGTTVESAQLPVGMSVSISVEAIGNITTSTSGGQSGGAVGTTTTTVVSNGRIAYYQTSERLPAEGLTLNVNMANYKTEYHKVTLEARDFDRVSEEVYVADGSSYTLPNYGTYTPSAGLNGGVPLKHTGWKMYGTGSDTPPVYPVGASVTITGDRTFELQYESGITVNFSAIDQNYSVMDLQLDDTIYYSNNGQQYIFLNIPFTLPRAKKEDSSGTRTEVTQWQWYEDGGVQKTGVPGEKITFTSGTSFSIQTQ